MESEKSIKDPFSAMGSCLLLADTMLSACSAAKPGGFLQFPVLLYWIQSQVSLLIPVCSVISGHGLDAMSLKKENYVRHWMTGMNETWLTIPSKPFHFTFPEGKMLPICFHIRLWSSHSSHSPMRKPLNFQRHLEHLGVCSVLYAPTGRAHIILMCPLQGLNYQISLQCCFLINIMGSTG